MTVRAFPIQCTLPWECCDPVVCAWCVYLYAFNYDLNELSFHFNYRQRNKTSCRDHNWIISFYTNDYIKQQQLLRRTMLPLRVSLENVVPRSGQCTLCVYEIILALSGWIRTVWCLGTSSCVTQEAISRRNDDPVRHFWSSYLKCWHVRNIRNLTHNVVIIYCSFIWPFHAVSVVYGLT